MDDNTVNVLNPSCTSLYALRVALHTMKERCLLQEKRLADIENENKKLRECIVQDRASNNNSNNNNNKVLTSHNSGSVGENFQLRMQVSELQRQNEQLTARINMVSGENRKLWSRLSQIVKEKVHDTVQYSNDQLNINGDIGRMPGVNQNLIRSKTFTQHSPNPNLRHKLIATDNAEVDLAHIEDNVDEAFSNALESAAQISFSFFNEYADAIAKEHSTDEQDFHLEAKKCIEGLQDMRRKAMQQNQQLNSLYAAFKSKLASNTCEDCIHTLKKPEMADKSLETDESFNEHQQSNNNNNVYQIPQQLQQQIQTQPCMNSELNETLPNVSVINTAKMPTSLNTIEGNASPDKVDKMCPMCGRIFDCRVPFGTFCEHVENHFLDNSDMEVAKEQNYEIISHVVGNF